MSVTTDLTFRTRPLPYSSPSLPESIWFAQGAVVGDASGGYMELLCTIAPGGKSSGKGFSLEQVLPTLNVYGASYPLVHCYNFDIYGPGLANPVSKSFSVAVQGHTSYATPQAAALVRDSEVRVFLGNQGTPSVDATIRLQLQNAVGQTFGVYMTGYIWPASWGTNGARRPVDGLL